MTKVVNGYEMMKIRNAEHNHTEIKKPKKGAKRKKSAKPKIKKQTIHPVPKLIRPQLSNQSHLIDRKPKMPKLTPKTILPKLTPKIEKLPPIDDAENIIVDIID